MSSSENTLDAAVRAFSKAGKKTLDIAKRSARYVGTGALALTGLASMASPAQAQNSPLLDMLLGNRRGQVEHYLPSALHLRQWSGRSLVYNKVHDPENLQDVVLHADGDDRVRLDVSYKDRPPHRPNPDGVIVNLGTNRNVEDPQSRARVCAMRDGSLVEHTNFIFHPSQSINLAEVLQVRGTYQFLFMDEHATETDPGKCRPGSEWGFPTTYFIVIYNPGSGEGGDGTGRRTRDRPTSPGASTIIPPTLKTPEPEVDLGNYIPMVFMNGNFGIGNWRTFFEDPRFNSSGADFGLDFRGHRWRGYLEVGFQHINPDDGVKPYFLPAHDNTTTNPNAYHMLASIHVKDSDSPLSLGMRVENFNVGQLLNSTSLQAALLEDVWRANPVEIGAMADQMGLTRGEVYLAPVSLSLIHTQSEQSRITLGSAINAEGQVGGIFDTPLTLYGAGHFFRAWLKDDVELNGRDVNIRHNIRWGLEGGTGLEGPGGFFRVMAGYSDNRTWGSVDGVNLDRTAHLGGWYISIDAGVNWHELTQLGKN